MQKFWGDLVDQVAFVNYVPWENVYDFKNLDIATPCSDLWRRMFIWWDGKANPCDVDYKSKLSVGEIGSKSISEIWKSPEYEKLRKSHISKKDRVWIRVINVMLFNQCTKKIFYGQIELRGRL